MWRRSSRSGSTPSRTNPPSRASAGGSSAMVDSIQPRTSASSSSSPRRLRTSGASQSSSSSDARGTTASDARRPARSRGPAVDSAMRDIMRSRSWMPLNASRTLARSVERMASSSTASSRSRMRSSTTSGRSSQARSSRPPIAVTVRSISWSSEPWRPPSIASTTSRCFSVVGSISSVSPTCFNRTLRTCASSAFCVSRR